MIEAMAFDAGRMGTLITFLLDAARLSSGQLKLAVVPMDLTALATQVQTDLSRPELVPIEVSGERLVLPVDGERFRTILTALVEACRWWGEEGPVRIGVEPGPPVTVRVSRSKTALDRAAARDLFGPRPPGSGGGSKVGLFVANGLAKAHGGALEVDAGERIEFDLTLPGTPQAER
jgi:signal transduction histidine kinase